MIRPYDICVRYAGDEFIVVLAGCGFDEAENKRKELQDAISETVFEARPGTPVPLSISAGSAVFPHDGDSYESLLAKADSRMYRDKVVRKSARAGRRSCVVGNRGLGAVRLKPDTHVRLKADTTCRSRGIRRPRAALPR